MKTPTLSDSVIFSDDAQLAARLACVLTVRGQYVPIIDGPRMLRADRESETIRRANAASRAKAKIVFLAGLAEQSRTALTSKFPAGRCVDIDQATDLSKYNRNGAALDSPLVWGRSRVGIGLLKALRARRSIAFEDRAIDELYVPPTSNHLVVCEQDDELQQVIAASYAHALGAGLFLIPKTDRDVVDQILELFYTVYDSREKSASESLRELGSQLRAIAGDIPIPANGSVTFISGGLPLGFAFPEVPATHLFGLDLGIAVLHGFAAEQPGSRGVQVATLVNPETTPAPEIDAAAKMLAQQRVFVEVYRGKRADVTSISEMIELFPYDLLVVATHCGDVSGHRWTYEYVDSEGRQRKLVVDIALGVGRTEEKDLLHITQFLRFVSLDGVPWNEPDKKAQLYVGTAINDFMEMVRPSNGTELKPTHKDTVPRVIGSAALKMHDDNFIALPRSLANERTPIIINNACVSWQRLAGNFMFGGARGYVGTLFPISTTEAESVLLRALGKHHRKDLPHAFWSAQRETYSDNPRRPYVVAGVYTQRIRTKVADVPSYIIAELERGLDAWTRYRGHGGPHAPAQKTTIDAHIRFFEREIKWFRRKFEPS